MQGRERSGVGYSRAGFIVVQAEVTRRKPGARPMKSIYVDERKRNEATEGGTTGLSEWCSRRKRLGEPTLT